MTLTRQGQLKYCKVCNIKGFDSKIGIVCSLTNAKPTFANTCEDFSRNDVFTAKELKRQKEIKKTDVEVDFYKTRIRPLFGIVALLVIGFYMIKDPYLLEDVATEGRKIFIKGILKSIWGRPVGAFALLVGFYYSYVYTKSIKSK